MMHEHLVTMAETLIIPSLGPVTSEELSDLAPSRQKSLSGYGPVEWIGVRRKSGLLSHLVPFIRDQMFDETTFWDVGAGPVHPELFLDPVSIPIVRYSTRVHHEKTPRKKRKKVSRIRANVLLEEEDNQQLDEDNTQPDDSKIQASDEESKSQAMEEDQDPAVPDDWGCSLANARIGTFAVIQVAYERQSQSGVSVVKVKRRTMSCGLINMS